MTGSVATRAPRGGRLTAVAVRNARSPGRYPDGAGLALLVEGSGQRRWWQFRYFRGRAREMSFGNADHVSLAEAREKAQDAHRLLAQGRDPLEERRTATRLAEVATSFAAVAESYIASHEAGWSNTQHRYQWRQTITQFANPVIGNLAVADITMRDVLAVLGPIWTTKTETATRLRGRIEQILAFATVHGLRPEGSANPAVWRGCLQLVLPAPGKVAQVEHHAALPWREMPTFWAKLGSQGGMATLALRFTILTAARSGEVRGALWGEMDRGGAMWTVPAARMKVRKPHRVPLSDAALAVLDTVQGGGEPAADDVIFHRPRRRIPLSDRSMIAVLRRMGRVNLSVHGFRSSFRDWAAEATDHANHVVEQALAHAIGSAIERAYRRGDLFEKRVTLMRDWGRYCAGR
jgi:integrase